MGRLQLKWSQVKVTFRLILITAILVCFMLSALALKNVTDDFLDDEAEEDEGKLVKLKVPGPESLCPEYKKDAGFTDRIVFVHTSGELCLTPRSLCGIESAARANPNITVYLYINTGKKFKSPVHYGGDLNGKIRSCDVTKVLHQLPNVKFIYEDLVEYLRGTRFWNLYEEGEFSRGEWTLVHLSDAIRLVILQKYGGFYLDFDTITFRPLHCLRNAMSYLEDYPHIENGVMSFEKDNPFLGFTMRYMSKVYDPESRMTLGPPTVAASFMFFCKQTSLTAGNYSCHNGAPVNLVHPDAFYPVRHTEWPNLYEKKINQENVERMKNSFLAHIYGANWGYKVPQTSMYASLARQYCPSVWSATKEYRVYLGF